MGSVNTDAFTCGSQRKNPLLASSFPWLSRVVHELPYVRFVWWAEYWILPIIVPSTSSAECRLQAGMHRIFQFFAVTAHRNPETAIHSGSALLCSKDKGCASG